jgi:hypothetical protein
MPKGVRYEKCNHGGMERALETVRKGDGILCSRNYFVNTFGQDNYFVVENTEVVSSIGVGRSMTQAGSYWPLTA